MNNPDTWEQYAPIPWNGELLPDGAYIALRARQCAITNGTENLNRWVTTMPLRVPIPEDPEYDYITVPDSGPDTGCVFKVTSLSGRLDQLDCYPGLGPSAGQLILLQGASGNYFTIDTEGNVIVSGSKDGAVIFCLGMGRGQATVLYNISLNYDHRSLINVPPDSYIWSNWALHGLSAFYLNKFDPQVYNTTVTSILYSTVNGDGGANAVLDLFVMTDLSEMVVADGTRVRDLNNGEIYLTLDGTLRSLSFPGIYESLFLPGSRDDSAKWLSVNGIARLSKYSIGRKLGMGNWTFLGAAPRDDRVFLIVDDTKRLISSEAVFERFGFNRDAVRTMEKEDLEAMEDGPVIS